MSRKLNDWLNGYLKYTENSEPPQSYHIWCGLGTLAAAAQRKVYMRWGRQTIYPNLYIVLIGPSGKGKKGTALDHCRPFIYTACGQRVIEGAITREKLIRRMSGTLNTFTCMTSGRILPHCSATFISAELAVFLGQNNIKLLADLCDWYDSPSSWTYDTKNEGTDKLDNLCFNMIAASAPEWLDAILPPQAIGGGFTSRVFWIVEEFKGKTVVMPTIDRNLELLLREDIERITLLSGEFQFTERGMARYSEWYIESDRMEQDGRPAILDPKMAGYCDRRATHVKKISMLISMSEGNTLTITTEQFDRALSLMELAERKMSRAFRGIGASQYANAIELMMGFVAKHKVVTRAQVLRFFYRDIDNFTFEVCMTTLQRMGVIDVVHEKDEFILTLKDDRYLLE